MAKRELVQLAKNFDSRKHGVAGWFASEKLDGMRAIWDGGITRGVPLPSCFPISGVGTGLWSRYMRPIIAPDWWLDQLPPTPLDGELWMGVGTFQRLVGVVKRKVNLLETEWIDVKFHVFDLPNYEQLFMPGRIKNGVLEWTLGDEVLNWVRSRLKIRIGGEDYGSYKGVFSEIKRLCTDSKVLVAHEQVQLPFNTSLAADKIDLLLRRVTNNGGEGLILRHPIYCWQPKRTDSLLKLKPYHDGEGVVVGYNAGKGKYLGMMGSLALRTKDFDFDLSGFTDAERQLEGDLDWVSANPGSRIPIGVAHSPRFPIGTVVNYLYRELTVAGVPKEARFNRVLG